MTCDLRLVCRSLFQELIRNYQLLNFRRAFINSQRAHVAIETLDNCATQQACTAVNLYSLIDNATGCFGSEEFCFAGFAR